MKNPNHPIWSLLHLVVVLAFVTLFSWLNASNFDGTEVQMLIESAVAIGGWEFVRKKMQGDKK